MQSRSVSCGFSLLEVMVAIALLATGVTMMLGSLVTQHQGRGSVRDTQRVTELVTTLRERLFSEPWTPTGTTTLHGLGVSTWSTPGVFNQTNPFGGTGRHDEAALLAAGIIVQPTGLTDLSYYLEYYRADTLSATQRGLFDKGTDANNDDIYDTFASATESRAGLTANLTAAQRFSSAPTSSIGADEPLAIRIVVVWRGLGVLGAQTASSGGGTVRYIESFLARGAN
ncbi:MAG TPA: hypothetical protein DCS97_08500 [Planctomycetes bacterium]|nr:hypothetical protein [Planctomycetota bacterium]